MRLLTLANVKQTYRSNVSEMIFPSFQKTPTLHIIILYQVYYNSILYHTLSYHITLYFIKFHSKTNAVELMAIKRVLQIAILFIAICNKLKPEVCSTLQLIISLCLMRMRIKDFHCKYNVIRISNKICILYNNI